MAKKSRRPDGGTMIGSQPFERATAYELGKGCPIGQEPILLLGLQELWPELPIHEARDEFFRGLADRFATPNQPTGARSKS